LRNEPFVSFYPHRTFCYDDTEKMDVSDECIVPIVKSGNIVEAEKIVIFKKYIA